MRHVLIMSRDKAIDKKVIQVKFLTTLIFIDLPPNRTLSRIGMLLNSTLFMKLLYFINSYENNTKLPVF